MKRYGVVIFVDAKRQVIKMAQVRNADSIEALKDTLSAEMMVLLDSLGIDFDILDEAERKGLKKDTKEYIKYLHDAYDERWTAAILTISPDCELSDASCINMMNKQLSAFVDGEYCTSCKWI